MFLFSLKTVKHLHIIKINKEEDALGTFIVLALTIMMMINFTKSLFSTKKKREMSKKSIMNNMKMLDPEKNDDAHMAKVAIYLVLSVAVFLFVLFFIISAVIFDNDWMTYLAALLSVLIIRSLVGFVRFMKTKEFPKITVFSKITTGAIAAYSWYFFIYYLNIRFEIVEMTYLFSSISIGFTLAAAFKRRKKV